MEDPTRIYAIPSRYGDDQNGTSTTHLVDVNTKGSMFKRKDFYKKASILLVFILLLLLLILFVMISYYVNSYNELKRARNICITPNCLRSASNFQLSMNLAVDPCDDFYEFSCGRWSKEHPNHGWYQQFSGFQAIEEKVSINIMEFLSSNETADEPNPVKQTRYLYKSCMDIDAANNLGYTVILKYLKRIGLPQVPNFFNVSKDNNNFKFNWMESSMNMKKQLSMDVFIQFNIDADIYNTSNNVLYIGSSIGGSPLPGPFNNKNKKFQDRLERSDTADDDDDDEDMKTKEELLLNMEKGSKIAMKQILTGILENVTKVPNAAVLEEAVNLLWNISGDVSELAGANETSLLDLDLRKFKVSELQKVTDAYLVSKNRTPMVVWKPLINLLFNDTKDVNFDFENDYVYISAVELPYLSEILVYISNTPDLILELYNWWLVVRALIMNTTSDIREYIYKHTSIYYDDFTVARPRSLECANLVKQFMGIAVSYGIAESTFVNRTKPKIERMLDDIKEAFVQRVKKIKWMDSKTKKVTLEKCDEMMSFIGFPDWLLNKTAMVVYYENITINSNTHLENLITIIETYTPSMLKEFRDVNEKSWKTDPTTVNAYHYFAENTITVPMAILSQPVYHLGLEVLNYGAIGSVLGHELTHGFDNLGRKFDKYGNLNPWWTNETIDTFEEKTECFVDQYNKFYIPSIKASVDGKLTLGENLADNGGINHAYLAYQNHARKCGPEPRLPGFEKYTNNQLFFIAYGSLWCEAKNDKLLQDQIENDEHSPSTYRILGTLQNLPEFATAFNCPLGSRMNPNKTRCRIW